MEKYILDRSMHFGFLKESFSKGTVFTVNRDKKNIVTDDGKEYDDIRDVEIAIRNGFLKEWTEECAQGIMSSKKADEEKKEEEVSKFDNRKPAPKMKVVKSDSDLMERTIDISHTKNKTAEQKEKNGNLDVVREEVAETIRGVNVVRQIDENTNIQTLGDATASDIGDPSNQIGGEKGKIVAKTSDFKGGSKKYGRNLDNEIKEKFSKRREQIEKNRKKSHSNEDEVDKK